MATEHAVPQKQDEKKQGDMLDNVLSKGTGLSQDPTDKKADREPADEPLK